MNFSPKRTDEVEIFTVDYAPILAPGETLLSAAWTATVVAGIDPNPNAIISGAAVINGTKVSQFITGGIVGVTYAPICRAPTSLQQSLDLPDPGNGMLLIVP